MTRSKKKLPPNVRERNGRYTFRYSVEVIEDGKKKRKQKETQSYATPNEAYEAGVLIKAQQIQGTYVDEKNLSFAQWADKWLEMYEEKEKKDHTIFARRSQVRLLKKEFGHMRLKDITSMHYQSYLYKLKKDGKKKNTILATHAVMVMIAKKAVYPPFELISKDFTLGVELPEFKNTLDKLKGSKTKLNFLEKEELASFIKTGYKIAEQAENDKEKLSMRQLTRALHILAYTGLRIGELCALTKEDIDYEEKKINIIKTLNIQHGVESYILDTPKNTSSIREVDITDKVVSLLKEQDLERKKFKLMMGNSTYMDEDFLFINMQRKTGSPLSYVEIGRFMTKVLEEAKLDTSLTPHKLRHTYTSLMAEAGIELADIQRQLGHANDAMTRQVYLHVTKAKRKTNVDKFEKLMQDLL